jgi:AcrR family transcriptional regulator
MQDTRNAILDAADRLMAHFGYQKMTMEDIAREAGIGKRTIYLHFESKEELALATADRNIERLVERLREVAESEAEPEVRIRQLLRTRVAYMFDRAQEYHAAFESLLSALRPAYMLRRERYVEAEARVIAQVICEGQADGSLAEGSIADDAMISARLLILATNALLPFSLSARALQEREAVLERAERMAGLLLDGLRARPTDSDNGFRHK